MSSEIHKGVVVVVGILKEKRGLIFGHPCNDKEEGQKD
jgi:hypothetical protein